VPFVERKNSRVVGVYANSQPGYANEWLDDDDIEVVAFFNPPEPPAPFRDLSRPAFLFMMNKIGITEATVEAIIDAMPEETTEQQDAKALALIVFKNQQTFRRSNQLLAALAAGAGLTEAQVDAAWRTAEQIVW
jgi:hypothetical protein